MKHWSVERSWFYGALIPALIIGGCAAPNASNRQYSASALSMAARTVEGIVVSKRPVHVGGTSGLGGATGVAMGGIAGSSIGGNARDNLVGAIAGGVIGGLVGAAVEANATAQDAYEYIVKSDVTGLMTLIQADSNISVGDRVFIVLASKPVLVKNESQAKP